MHPEESRAAQTQAENSVNTIVLCGFRIYLCCGLDLFLLLPNQLETGIRDLEARRINSAAIKCEGVFLFGI